ncbi:hypothetical protein D3C78_1210850 [compost metagenome]
MGELVQVGITWSSTVEVLTRKPLVEVFDVAHANGKVHRKVRARNHGPRPPLTKLALRFQVEAFQRPCSELRKPQARQNPIVNRHALIDAQALDVIQATQRRRVAAHLKATGDKAHLNSRLKAAPVLGELGHGVIDRIRPTERQGIEEFPGLVVEHLDAFQGHGALNGNDPPAEVIRAGPTWKFLRDVQPVTEKHSHPNRKILGIFM